MKKIILLSILLFAAYKSYGLYKKYRHSKRLSVRIEGFQLQNFKLTQLLDEVTASVQVAITNFSESIFRLHQIKVDVYSSTGQLIAEQSEPLTQEIQVGSNQTTVLSLSFHISSSQFRKLIKQSGGVLKVGANYLKDGAYGIPLQLKGILEAEGITITIHEKITV